jgi:hypothetical protein
MAVAGGDQEVSLHVIARDAAVLEELKQQFESVRWRLNMRPPTVGPSFASLPLSFLMNC